MSVSAFFECALVLSNVLLIILVNGENSSSSYVANRGRCCQLRDTRQYDVNQGSSRLCFFQEKINCNRPTIAVKNPQFLQSSTAQQQLLVSSAYQSCEHAGKECCESRALDVARESVQSYQCRAPCSPGQVRIGLRPLLALRMRVPAHLSRSPPLPPRAP
jgi:hypothetical protein